MTVLNVLRTRQNVIHTLCIEAILHDVYELRGQTLKQIIPLCTTSIFS